MLGESKFDVLTLVPDNIKPKTIRVRVPSSTQQVMDAIDVHQFNFPVIFKPDLGERGWMVRIIHSTHDVELYLKEIKIDFIIQELVDLPLEFGVFYVRFPNEKTGFVNSITMKEFLNVVGDGKSTLQQLILTKDRAKLQWDVLRIKYQDELQRIPAKNERVELVPIGNHCLGTTFLNGNHLITGKLNESF